MLANDLELKDCPFCGNEAITFEPDADRNIVSCKLGHAPMRTIEGWNTRTQPTMREQIEGLIAELETDAEQLREGIANQPLQWFQGQLMVTELALVRLRAILESKN